MLRPLRAPGVAGRCALIATCAFAASVLAGRFPIANAEPSRYAATAYGGEERARELYLDGLERCFAGSPTMAGLTLGYAAPAERAHVAQALDALSDVAAGTSSLPRANPAP